MVVVGTWNLENLYRPGGEYGPRDEEAYRGKLGALAGTIERIGVDVLAVQEVGEPEALADLVELLPGSWDSALSEYPDDRGIRVGFLARLPIEVVADVAAFPPGLAPVQVGDAGETTARMNRGALAVAVEPVLHLVTCHLKSKLLTFADGRFGTDDEGERARAGAYALYQRAAEAVTVRALADDLLDGRGRERAVVVLGDLNDVPEAATTQILLGPPGSELGTAGAEVPDRGDGARLWNLAPLIPEAQRYSRIYRGRGELIDQILVSHALLDAVRNVRSVGDRPLPSVTDDPARRRDARDSDHAPVVVTLL